MFKKIFWKRRLKWMLECDKLEEYFDDPAYQIRVEVAKNYPDKLSYLERDSAWQVRYVVASTYLKLGKNIDIFIKDKSDIVRSVIASDKNYHQLFTKDKSAKVRAKSVSTKTLDILKYDKSPLVRAACAKIISDCSIYTYDKSPLVRVELARRGKLSIDTDLEVQKAIYNYRKNHK